MKQFRYIMVFAVLMISGTLFAQQEPTFTMYKYNMNIFNPGYVGASGYTELNMNIRSQWSNVDGAPQTQSLSFIRPMNDKVALGISILNDKVDVIKETDVAVDFSYRVMLDENADLYLGVKGGFYSFKADLTEKGIQGDPLFDQNISRINGIFGAGAYLKMQRFYATLSVPNFLGGQRVEDDDLGTGNYTEARDKLHVYTGAGYSFDLSENLKLEPSVLARIVQGAPASFDLNAMAVINDKFEFGGSYRIDDSFSAIAMLQLTDWMELGYAYEFTTSEINNYSNGSHEFMLRFNLSGSSE
ncbi:type IX secretion system membrane protein PorP/SprF [Urechidicola sp. KH5]